MQPSDHHYILFFIYDTLHLIHDIQVQINLFQCKFNFSTFFYFCCIPLHIFSIPEHFTLSYTIFRFFSVSSLISLHILHFLHLHPCFILFTFFCLNQLSSLLLLHLLHPVLLFSFSICSASFVSATLDVSIPYDFPRLGKN